MKKVRILYISGLAYWLKDNGIKWERIDSEPTTDIYIYYDNEADLFKMGFMYGKFYMVAAKENDL